MTAERLRTGLVVEHRENEVRGVVIDWGIKDHKLRRYVPLPSYNKMAEWVRVWTSSGETMEVWPIISVTVKR